MRPNFFRRLLNFLGKRGRIYYERLRGRTIIHYVHIGKNAGTAIKNTLGDLNASSGRRYYFNVYHSHRFTQGDVRGRDLFFFSTRDPVERFYSGFYSRKRMGMPRLYNPHSAGESRAFGRFSHANDLAEALSCEDDGLRRAAIVGMKTIRHVRTDHWDWFDGASVFDDPRLVGILAQERLEADMQAMLDRLGVRHKVEIPSDPVKAHKNDYTDSPPLSQAAKQNIRRWYARDDWFLWMCGQWARENTGRHASAFD